MANTTSTVPMASKHPNLRCQVDTIDMRKKPDGEYRFIMHYQENMTGFTVLQPLKTDSAKEVTHALANIFRVIGVPCVLSSSKGRPFSRSVCDCFAAMQPGQRILAGPPRHTYYDFNKPIREMLASWLTYNDTSQWAQGLRFLQMRRNQAENTETGVKPHDAMFGCGNLRYKQTHGNALCAK